MTRCYEYYCLFVCKDEDCKLKEVDPVTGKEKSRRGIFYIRKYIKFMQNKGVKFDKTLEDKQYFFDMVDKYGSEREVTQRQVQHVALEKSKPSESRKNVIQSDIRDILKHIKNPIDLILTDPPYPREYLELWPILFENANLGLKDGGFLVTYAPQIYLPTIFSFVPKDLNYVWTIAQIHAGGK